jgi:predicted dehydrogenase
MEKHTMKAWLVGSGYWGSKVKATLEDLGHEVSVIDIRNGNTIDDINTSDPVILATPVWEHYNQASVLLKKGYDVYIEKPAAENADHVESLLDLVTDQIVMVGHIFVHNPLIDRLKDLIDNGTLGNIKFIHSERTNLGIYQTKTSTLLSLAPHDFSIVEHLTGSLAVRSARGYKLSDNVQHDRVTVFGDSGNIPWQIDVSWRWPIRRRIVTVVGDTAQAVWDEDLKTIEVYYNKVEDGKLTTVKENETIFTDHSIEPLAIELAHFFDCVKSRRTPKTNLESALTIAEAIDTANYYL